MRRRFLAVEEVLALHKDVLHPNEPDEVLNRASLESAVMRSTNYHRGLLRQAAVLFPALTPPPMVVTPPTTPKNLTLGEIARNGTDFRDLMKDLDKKVGPAPVKTGDLVGILSSRCGLSPDSLSCREFKPLFRDGSLCGSHLSMASCVVNDTCRWFLNSCMPKQ